MLKLTSMSNTLPPINAHARSSLDDIRGDGSGEPAGNAMGVKHHQQQIRRQQTLDRHRRSPLRTNPLVPSTGNKYVTTSPFASNSSLVRSPSIVHTGSLAQTDPTKTVYRSADNVWNEQQSHPNVSPSHLRSSSPLKNKLAVLSQRLANGPGHDSTAGKPITHISFSTQQQQHQQQSRDAPHNGDLLLSSTSKSYHAMRRRHTNSFLDKPSGAADISVSMRREIDRSQFPNTGSRTQQVSSKQRNYVNSKTSFYEVNERDIYTGVAAGDNSPPMNSLASTQRLYESTIDLTANKKPLSTTKSRSFHVPANGTGQSVHYKSTQDVHGHEVTNDRTDYPHFETRRATSKEQIMSTTNHRRTPGDQSAASARVVLYTPGERHPSAQSYASRDPNISYAYTDVKKYIEENALMSSEKDDSIRQWICEVDRHRHEFQKVE